MKMIRLLERERVWNAKVLLADLKYAAIYYGLVAN